MNNRAYNKAKEHLQDFTKFPTINDIVLLMEEQSKETAIDFAEWILTKDDPSFNITTSVDRSTEERKEVAIWGTSRLGYGKTWTSEQLYEQFLKEQENEMD